MIGKLVLIEEMQGEPQYHERVGIIDHIDDIGQIHGSWGGCALCQDADKFRIIEETDPDIRDILLTKFFRPVFKDAFGVYVFKGYHSAIIPLATRVLSDLIILWDDCNGTIIAIPKDYRNIKFTPSFQKKVEVQITASVMSWTLNIDIGILKSLDRNSQVYKDFCFYLKHELVQAEARYENIKKLFSELPEEDQLMAEVLYDEI